MNSVETIAKVPTAMEPTASHAEREAGTGCAGAPSSSMHGLLLGEFIMMGVVLWSVGAGARTDAVEEAWSVRAVAFATKGPRGSRQFPGDEQWAVLMAKAIREAARKA